MLRFLSGAFTRPFKRLAELSLLAAVNYNMSFVTRLLIKIGANVNCTDYRGYSPLLIAVMKVYHHENKIAIVKSKNIIASLIAAGADVNFRPIFGCSLLSEAVRHRNLDTVKALLAAKADVNATDERGYTPLMEICESLTENPVDVEILRCLIGAGANINHTVTDRSRKEITAFSLILMQLKIFNRSPLHHYISSMAIKYASAVNMCRTLLFYGAKFNDKEQLVTYEKQVKALQSDMQQDYERRAKKSNGKLDYHLELRNKTLQMFKTRYPKGTAEGLKRSYEEAKQSSAPRM